MCANEYQISLMREGTISSSCKIKIIARPIIRTLPITKINIKKEASFDELAIALGCSIKRKDVDDCVRRYLPSIAGTGPLTLEQINEVKNDSALMGEIVHVIEAMNRANNQSSNQPEPQEGPPQDQANATSNPTWRTDNAGRGYWDYGNGFGWMPGNKIYDKIISGFSIDNNIKQRLYTGSGRSVTMSNGRVNIW